MTGPRDEAAFEAWVDRARATTCRAELERRGLWSRKMLGDAGVPCPGCGGRDRFAVNLKKNLFVCRRSGVGGDAIALVRHVDECSFLVAVETLTGEPPPDRSESEDEAARAARIARIEARDAARAETARKQRADGERYRAYERRAAFDIWCAGKPARGTPVEAYLAGRGLAIPPGARLKFHPDLPYFVQSDEHKGRPLFSGPAMLAVISGADGAAIGVHRTWLETDGDIWVKRAIYDPDTGELLKAKKSRGSVRGGIIKLFGFPPDGGAVTAARLVLGEGIETTLSVCAVMSPAERSETAFAAGVSLGNMAGKAAGRVPHPTATRPDKRKTLRRVFVPDGVPAADDDTPLLPIPASVTELVLLGDGDSDAFATGLALQRAAARFAAAYPGLTVRCAMARAGLDFNDMLRDGEPARPRPETSEAA